MRLPKSSIDELYEHLLDLYKEEHRDTAWDLESFMADAFPKFEWEIAQGSVRLDLHAVAWNALRRADRKMLDGGKRFIIRERKRQAAGWMALDGDMDWLNVTVALGKNERVRYGAVRYPELGRIHELKRENFERVRTRWIEWQADEELLTPALKEGMSIEEAVADHRILRIPDLFADGGE